MAPTFTFAYAYLVNGHPCHEPLALSPALSLITRVLAAVALFAPGADLSIHGLSKWKPRFRFHRRNVENSKAACLTE